MGTMSGYDSGMREPTSTLWKVLKIVFLILNILVTIGIILSIVGCVALGAIASGKITDGDGNPLPDEAVQTAKIALAIAVPMILLQTLQVVLGFVGVCKLHLGSLYVYTVFVVINLILNIVSSAMAGFSAGVIGQIGIILMMYFLINELRKANNMV